MTANDSTTAVRARACQQKYPSNPTPRQANQTNGGVAAKHKRVYSQMPTMLAPMFTEYASTPLDEFSRYQPTSCPRGTKVIAIRPKSGITIDKATLDEATPQRKL